MKLIAVLLICLFLPISLPADEGRAAIGDDDVLGILQYVYYWYLDHDDISQLSSRASVDVYLSRMVLEQDPGDNTVFTQMLVPALNLEITIKKAHYRVTELAREIRHPGPKIAAIHRNPVDPKPEGSSTLRSFATKTLLDFLHDHRNQGAALDAELYRRLKRALGAIVVDTGNAASGAGQTFYVGPESAYSNDLWIYWIQQKKLILFSSDLSFSDSAYWKHLPLYTKIFDLESAVVTSLSEAPGMNGYVTKGWAGRILFNTLVDGVAIQIGAKDQ